MTERTVAVRLDANVQRYIAEITRASVATKQFADKASTAIGKNREGINSLSRGAGLLGAGLAVGVVAAGKAYADFDSAISGVAATGLDARQNLQALRAAAVKAGADTKFNATEAAGGLEALAKANVSATDSLNGGLKGALNLTAAGNLSVAESADVAAIAMNQFKLQGKDVPHIADLLAAGAGKANGEVSDLAMALKQSGLVASQTGLSLEETVGTLAQFADAGLLGSDAGTSFKTMLQALTPTSAEAAALMKRLGISAYDAQGNFVGMANFADNLKTSLSKLSVEQQNAALKTIFGSDAVRAASIVFRDGAAGTRKWTNEVNDSGYAAEVAAIKMDNLKGDIEVFSGSVETALIGLGESSDGPLRKLFQNATQGVNAFNDLESGTKATFLAIGGGIGVTALAAAGVGKLATAANDTKIAFKGLGISAKGASLATLGIGAAVGVAAYAYGKWATAQAESQQRVEDFTVALEGQTEAINENTRKVAAKRLEDAGALKAAQAYGLSLETVTNASLGNADAQALVQRRLDGVKAALDQQIAAGTGAADVTGEASKAYGDLRDAVFGTSEEFATAVAKAKRQEAAVGSAGAAADSSAGAYKRAGSALGKMGLEGLDAKKELDDMVSSLFAAADAALGLSDAQIGYEQAVANASKAAKDNKKSTDLSTEAGRNQREALNRLAGASHRYVEQLVGQGASTKKVEGATKDARAEFIKVAEKMGVSATKAKDLADKYGLIPRNIKTTITFDSNADEVAKKYKLTLSPAAVHDRHTPQRATGGLISGPGTGTSDSILGIDRYTGAASAWVSDGEFVVNARQTAKNLRALRAINNGLDLPGFAAGGEIGGKASATAGMFQALGDRLALQLGDRVARQLQKRLEKLLGESGAFGGAGAVGVGRLAQRALAHVGEAWDIGTCLRFVRMMAGAPGGTYDASAAWRNAQFKHRGDRNPPSGVPVYWGGGHGHIAASVGGGRIVTTDFPRTGRIGLTSLSRLTSAWGKPYLGWANDVNGVVTSKYGLPAMAGGGRLSGPGSGTSDSIPVWGSNGEYMVNAAATSRFLPLLEAINAQGLAAGGPVLRRTQGADVMRLIAAITAPLNDIARAFRDVNLRNREASQAHRGAVRADHLLDRAEHYRDTVGRRVNRLEKEARATKGVTAADRELKAARQELDRVDKVVTQRENAKTKAIDLSTEAKRRATDATQKLAEVQHALADAARQVSDQFAGQFRSTSSDVQDWIELMHTGSTDLVGFTKQLGQLRKAGLSEALIQQIIGMGAVAGGGIASQITAGGSTLVAQLNAANKGLEAAADALGYLGASGRQRKAGGGLISGPGTGTSDSVNILASNGEWVVPARAVPPNRGYLEAITYGRSVVAHNYARSHYAGGGYVNAGRGLIDTDVVKAALAGMSVYVQNPWTGEYHEARMEGVSMRVMDRETGKVATSF